MAKTASKTKKSTKVVKSKVSLKSKKTNTKAKVNKKASTNRNGRQESRRGWFDVKPLNSNPTSVPAKTAKTPKKPQNVTNGSTKSWFDTKPTSGNKTEAWQWYPDYTLPKYKNHGDKNKKRNVYFCADFAGFAWKEKLKEHLFKIGNYNVIDMGCYDDNFNDYPDYAEKMALQVANDKGSVGIAVCGSGIGVGIVCNKIKGIRCAIVHDATTARLSREHNNANIVSIGGWTTGPVQLYDIVDTFLTTKNEDIPFHNDRLDKISNLEKRYFK